MSNFDYKFSFVKVFYIHNNNNNNNNNLTAKTQIYCVKLFCSNCILLDRTFLVAFSCKIIKNLYWLRIYLKSKNTRNDKEEREKKQTNETSVIIMMYFNYFNFFV